MKLLLYCYDHPAILPFSGVPGDRTGLCEPLWSIRFNSQSSKWCTYCKHRCAVVLNGSEIFAILIQSNIFIV